MFVSSACVLHLLSPEAQVGGSVAAALLHHHVLVMPHHHLPVLVVQHGQRRQACGHAGETRDLVWVMELQQALEEMKKDGK